MSGRRGRTFGFIMTMAVLAALSLPSPAYPTDPLTLPLFSPESFIRNTGAPAPVERIFHVPSTQGTFTLTVLNGDGSGDNTASSAVITVNGATIVRTSDLNQNVSRLDVPLSNLTQGANNISVEVRSIPSSYVTVSVTGDYLLDIAITSPAAGSEILSDRATVSGSYSSYTGDLSVSVNGLAASLSAGTFTVSDVPLSSGSNTLTATIATVDGISDQDTVLVTSNRPPVAVAGEDRIVTVGDTVGLNGSGSFDPENSLITYAWDIAQRPSLSLAFLSNPSSVIPSFVPDLEGVYVFSLVVNDGRSESAPDNVTITAEHPNVAPTANAGPDQSAPTGSPVYLDGTGSFDPEGTPLLYNWAFLSRPGESTATLSDPLSPVPSFVADRDGTYLVGLTVSDGELSSFPDNVTVISATPNAPPVGNAGHSGTVSRNTLIHLDGTQSADPDGDPLAFLWIVVSKPAGSASILDNAASPTPTIVADVEGDFVFRLVVNDGTVDSDPATVVVTSVNDPPVADAGSDRTVPRNTVVNLDGSGSSDGNGDPLAFAWSVVSAPAGSDAAMTNPASVSPHLTPDLAGTYVIRLVVNDGRTESAPDTVTVTATPLSVTVPGVVGMAQTDAQSAIVAAGLAMGIVSGVNSDTVPAGNVISQDPAAGSVVAEGSPVSLDVSLGPAMVTVPHVVGLTEAAARSAVVVAGLAVGSETQANSATVPAGSVIGQAPAAGTAVVPGTSVDLVVSAGPVMVTVPDLFGKPQAFADADLNAVGLGTGTITSAASETVIPGGVASQFPPAGNIVPQGSTIDLVVSTGPAPVTLPPDPTAVAPPVDRTVTTDMHSSTQFLYTGSNPIQTGVAPGTISLVRAAVVRGQVLAADNAPLPGVAVTVLNHPELGQTLTRADGMFDMAVNGGGLLTINYRKGGYLVVQRQVDVPWQGYAVVPEVVLVPYDSRVTAVDLSSGAPIQVARGNVVTDSSGTRQATLLITQDTQATMIMTDNSSRSITKLSVRATEYTVGQNGPRSMPAALPPTSGYTYCVEFSIDEAVAAGAKEVRFSRPVITYLENFIHVAVGTPVPSGYYDRKKGQWVASDSGTVVRIVSVSGGKADLDIDGNGTPDNSAVIGVTDAEREKLATLYAPGTTLWRVPVNHFTPWDCNMAISPPPGAGPPGGGSPTGGSGGDDCIGPCCGSGQQGGGESNEFGASQAGSIIDCRTMTLGERLPVVGTPHTLIYRSDRVPGRNSSTLSIPLSGATLAGQVQRIDLEIMVAGRRFTASFPATANQSASFSWDGRDVYGRAVQGVEPITVRIGNVYRAQYTGTTRFGYNGNGIAITTDPSRQDITLWKDWHGSIGAPLDAAGVGIGGFTLDVHHVYDPYSHTLILGDGSKRNAVTLGAVGTVAGTGQRTFNGDDIAAKSANITYAYNVEMGPDGSIYIADAGSGRIRRITPDGIMTTVAGNGQQGHSGDGGPATQAMLSYPLDVALGPDGSIYTVEYNANYVRRIGPDGIITTVAGNGQTGYGGDGGPATQAALNIPVGVAVAPDGSLYITDQWNNRIRRVGTDGIITTVAGNGQRGYSGDGGPATQAMLNYPRDAVVGPDGSLYIADMSNSRIRRVSPAGIITTVAGSQFGYLGDGGPATQARISHPRNVAVDKEGAILIADYENNRIRYVDPSGIITTLAGNGQFGYNGDGAPALRTSLSSPDGISVGVDGALYTVDSLNYRIRRIGPTLPGYGYSDSLIPSDDGNSLFVFDHTGRHQRTVNTFTGSTLYAFGYDSAGRLVQVMDADNNATTIERAPDGVPLALVAPGGQRTVLELNGAGHLSSITYPGGATASFDYYDNGLMTRYLDPRRHAYIFDYDSMGRLTYDEDPEGGSKALDLEGNIGGNHTVSFTSALGRSTVYTVEKYSSGSSAGATRYTNRFPTGARAEKYVSPDRTATLYSSDGTVSTVVDGPDPRFGMEAPLAASTTVRTPGGLQRTQNVSRMAPLANPDDMLSLLSLTDNVTVNGMAYLSYYDAGSKRFTSTTPAGRQTLSEIDNVGRVLRVNVAPSVDNITLGYDAKGRISTAGQGGRNWAYGYDDLNRLTSKTDPLLHQVQYAYDNADRVDRVILPSGRTYGFAHDNNGNVTSITMPSGVVHQLGYNKVNLDNAYTPPNNPAYSTGYNLDREWVRTTLPSGRAIDGGYDNDGRLETIVYPEAGIGFTYSDNTHRVGTLTRTSAIDNQAIEFSYDGFLTTRIAYSGVANGEYRYSFDNNFWVTGVALDNVWTTVGHDNDGLLTRYGPFAITRNGPAGAPSALTDNTLSISYTYDSSGRPWTRTHTVNAQQVYQLTLGYDNVGRISTTTETVSGAAHTFDYEYDLDGQLFQVRKDGILVEQYGYDNNANRTSTLSTTATYDAQDRLIQQGGVNYTFDDDGYLTTRGSDTFTYSARGELLSATVGGQPISYHYDGMGRRIGKTDAAGTVQYLYGDQDNPFQITAIRDAAGILTNYFYDTAGNLFSFERGGVRYYVATDKLGTPKAVTDATGAVVKTVEYDAWGSKLSDSNPTFELPVGFAGGVADGVTGLVRFGYRDYEPGTGRWAARDPILFRGEQTNLYAYALNDSVNLVDPTGTFFVPGAIVGGAVGAVAGGFGVALGGDTSASAILAGVAVGAAGGFVGGGFGVMPGIGAAFGAGFGAFGAAIAGGNPGAIAGAALGGAVGGAIGGLPGIGKTGVAVGTWIGGVWGGAFGYAGQVLYDIHNPQGNKVLVPCK